MGTKDQPKFDIFDLFDPGGNLPEDCMEWIIPFKAALQAERELAYKLLNDRNKECNQLRQQLTEKSKEIIQVEYRGFMGGRQLYTNIQDDEQAWLEYTLYMKNKSSLNAINSNTSTLGTVFGSCDCICHRGK